MSLAPLLAATQNTSMFDPVSPPAESIRNLSVLVLAITGFIFMVVEGILIYCLHRFRHRAGRPGRPSLRRFTAASPSRSPGRRRPP